MTAPTPESMRSRAKFFDDRNSADALIASSTADMLRAAADQLEQLTEWVTTPTADTAPQKERDE